MYLIAIWVAIGSISVWRVAGSRILLGVIEWLLIPVLLHFHLSAPTSLWPRLNNVFWLGYILALCGAIAEIFQLTPYNAPLIGLSFAILTSIGLLIFRAFTSKTQMEKIAIRLMLTGLLFAFGPGVIYLIWSSIQSVPQANTLILMVAFLAIPTLPFFYVYALFKRQLGKFEFRANRLLATYGFTLIYPPLFVLSVLLCYRFIHSVSLRTVSLLFVSILFIYLSPRFFARFHRNVNRLAYGTFYNPEEIIGVIANKLPSILRKDLLISLLKTEVFKTLLIRESALFVLEGGEFLPWLNLGEANPPNSNQLMQLLSHKGNYLPSHTTANRMPGSVKWVRLVLPLYAGTRLVGIWIFGRRDPDDFLSNLCH